ncbi:VanZ family protein [Chitinibacteraceae bacterium HSL-7]
MLLITRITLALWALGIWIGSLMPLSQPPAPGGDKLHHFVAYGVLAALLALARLRQLPTLAHGFGFAVTMGIAVECAQGLFTRYRQFDTFDMMANAAGAALGIGLIALLRQRQRLS